MIIMNQIESGNFMARKVIIDAGHGGVEPGAIYNGRKEKDDNLQLAFDLGNALERRGIQVEYTRVNDVYDSPYEKAAMGNQSDADYFISLHRNAMPVPGTASGVQTLVYSADGAAGQLAKNIQSALSGVGWKDLGISERPGLVVLRNTRMPAVLVEAGFIDNPADNAFFDEKLAATADAIADGVVRTFNEMEQTAPSSGEEPGFYMVQTGIFRRREYAEDELRELQERGYPAFMVAKNGLYYVRAGAFRNLENAIAQERQLRQQGFATYLVRT